MTLRLSRRQFGLSSLALSSSLLAGQADARPQRESEPVIPGTGIRIARTGDDFEAEDWTFYPHLPKSSWNNDEQIRVPGGVTKNYLWAEGAKRGQPDVVKRVATPPGGPEGSTGAMLIQTLHSGVPGRYSGQQQQDDLLHNTQAQIGGRTIPVSWSPNCVCRVFIVPHELWERRNGATFGYRVGLVGWGKEPDEEYWPGIFVHMERVAKEGRTVPQMRLWVRADQYGRDLPSLTFEPESWITMGMSCTPDGRCHFYCRAGLDDLTAEDNIGSYWCYNYRAHSFQTFFFNVINTDDGRSVSTPWIIDDAYLYAASAPANKIKGVQTAEKADSVESTETK